MKFYKDLTKLKRLRKESKDRIDSLYGEELSVELFFLHNLEICISILESGKPLEEHAYFIKKH